jgi:hypothetical protein
MAERQYTTRQAVEHFMALCQPGDTTFLAAYVLSRIAHNKLDGHNYKMFLANFIQNAGVITPEGRDEEKSIEMTCKVWPAIWSLIDEDIDSINNQFVKLSRQYAEVAGIKMPSLLTVA